MSGLQQAVKCTVDNTNFCRVQYCCCILFGNIARNPWPGYCVRQGLAKKGNLSFQTEVSYIVIGLCRYWKSWEIKWDDEVTQRWSKQEDLTTLGCDTEPDTGAIAETKVRHLGSRWHHGGWSCWASRLWRRYSHAEMDRILSKAERAKGKTTLASPIFPI